MNIPNFFIIGVVKGGTTSLYHYLDQHPDIYLPPIKETNHFAASDIDERFFLKEYALDVKIDLAKYISSGMEEQIHIAHVNSTQDYQAIFSKVKGERAIGEVSNSYMICPSAPKAIYDFNPSAKILVILRNPIQRAWSQYLMNLREAKTQEPSFIDELKKDHAADPKGWGVNHQYLELGMYAQQLRRYFELFDRTNVLPIFYETYRESPEAVLAGICRFLGVDRSFKFDLTSESNKASMPRSKILNGLLVRSGIMKAIKDITPKKLRSQFAKIIYSDKDLPRISLEEEEWLRNYYREEVEALSQLINEDAGNYWHQFK